MSSGRLREHAGAGRRGMSEDEAAPFVRELVRLQDVFGRLPAPPLSVLTVAFNPGEQPQFVVQLQVAPWSVVIRSLVEWTSSLHLTSALVWRTANGDAAEIGVRGQLNYGGPSVQVWSRPVPYQKLGGLEARPGSLTVMGNEVIHRWAGTLRSTRGT
jgi:hypothetical protein